MGGSESLRACPKEDREIDNRASTNSFFIYLVVVDLRLGFTVVKNRSMDAPSHTHKVRYVIRSGAMPFSQRDKVDGEICSRSAKVRMSKSRSMTRFCLIALPKACPSKMLFVAIVSILLRI
jgi:hypothetical protein